MDVSVSTVSGRDIRLVLFRERQIVSQGLLDHLELIRNKHDEGVLAEVRDEERDSTLVLVVDSSLGYFNFQPEGVEYDEVE